MTQAEFTNLIYLHHGRTVFNKNETANALGGVSEETVDRLRKDGEIQSQMIRGQVMFTVVEIYRYLYER